MRKYIAASTLALALTLSACGDSEDATSASLNGEEIENIAAPEGQQWSEVVTATEAGGYVKGNPEAPIKIIEYGSLTCGHCATFDQTAYPALEEEYIDSGRVSLEFRNFTLNAVDIPAAVLTRCSGPESYFALTHQFYLKQNEILNQLQASQQQNQAALGQLDSLPKEQQQVAAAKLLGLTDYFKTLGISEDQANSCLADSAVVDELMSMNKVATEEMDVTGTPTFFINGEKMDFNTWAPMETKLKEMGAR